jgi:hypothetical protein
MATIKKKHQRDDIDQLVPDPQFARELGITLMSLWRWDRDPALQDHLPPRLKIRNRNFRRRSLIEAFKAYLLRSAIQDRRGTAA